MKNKILWVALPVTALLFFGVFYTIVSVAERRKESGASPIVSQPGTRCTSLSSPKVTKQQMKDYKAGKLSLSRCSRIYRKRTAKTLPNKPPVIASLRPQDAQGASDTVWSVPRMES